ncbi:hypothetical protein GJ496_008333 [Pomphorhynchus laevis]|nr:hypothetical protein GJ496_008333 [Pomphorhynchus laevis]
MTSEPLKRPRPIEDSADSNEDTDGYINKQQRKVIFTSVRLGPVENTDELEKKILLVQNRRLTERQRTWRKLELRFKQKISRLERQKFIHDKNISMMDQYCFRILRSIRNAVNCMELGEDLCYDEIPNHESLVNIVVENDINGDVDERLHNRLNMEAKYIDKFCRSINQYAMTHKLKCNSNTIKSSPMHDNDDSVAADCHDDGNDYLPCERCKLILEQDKENYEDKLQDVNNENTLLARDLDLLKIQLNEHEVNYEQWLIEEAKILASVEDMQKHKSEVSNGISDKQRIDDENKHIRQLSESRLTELNEYAAKCQMLTEEINDLKSQIEKVPIETIKNSEEYRELDYELKKVTSERENMYKTVNEVKSILHYQKQAYDSQLASVERDEITKQRNLKSELSSMQTKILSLEMEKSNLQVELESIKLHRIDVPENIEGFVKIMQKTMEGYIQHVKSERSHYRNELLIERQNKEALQKSLGLCVAASTTSTLNTNNAANPVNTNTENGIYLDITMKRKLHALEEILKSVRSELKSIKEQEDILVKELETTGLAFEEMHEKNRKLLMLLAERESANFRLITEGVQRSRCIDLLRNEKSIIQDTLKSSLQTELDLSTQLCNDQNKRIATLESSQTELEAKLHLSFQQEELLRSRLVDLEHKENHLRNTNEKLRREIDKLKSSLTENQNELEKRMFLERRLIEEDGPGALNNGGSVCAACRRGNLQLPSNKNRNCPMLSLNNEQYVIGDYNNNDNDGENMQLLQLEVQQLRESMKCSSCHTRVMDTVISKCFHVFCRECLQMRLESRQRKCPQCNAAFGANDIHRLYLYSS